MILRFVIVSLLTVIGANVFGQSICYEGDAGPGVGKHIVWLAGDHEYRSEETLPALARILARHHGFKCTVLFTVNPETGCIDSTADNLPETDVLQTADLMVVFLRFKNLPAEQMQPIVDYLERSGPVVGLRTSTHAFKVPADSPFARYDFQHKGEDYRLGFGRQVLGETWAGHYGTNHEMSTRLVIDPANRDHPILRGVHDMWVQSGGYWAEPLQPVTVLASAQPLASMDPDAEPAKDKDPCPAIWTRAYGEADGRVFTTTHGASQDLLNEGFRRCLVNACFWGVGLDEKISPDLNIEFVGPYHPSDFCFDGYVTDVRPADIATEDSPILK